MGSSSLCYLMNGLDLMKGRRLGPKITLAATDSDIFLISNRNEGT